MTKRLLKVWNPPNQRGADSVAVRPGNLTALAYGGSGMPTVGRCSNGRLLGLVAERKVRVGHGPHGYPVGTYTDAAGSAPYSRLEVRDVHVVGTATESSR